ncbi:MAG: lipid II:glycine glycyltransferase FemX [Bacillota bacterium]
MAQSFQYKLRYNNRYYWLRQISFREKQSFNDFIRLSDTGSVFQSYEWGELKRIYGWQPIRLLLEARNSIVGAATILKRTTAGIPFFYSPRGPALDYNKPHLLSLFCRGVDPLARREKAAFWRLDPELPGTFEQNTILSDSRLKPVPSASPFGGTQPRWVWRIPLAGSPEDQWLSLKKGARRQVNKARAAGITVQDGTKKDIPAFYNLLSETAKRNNFLLRSPKYYIDLWNMLSFSSCLRMLLAFQDRTPVATALAVGFGRGVWDIYAGNSHLNRNNGASYLLTWELISWASSQGYNFYDLGGIAPQVGQDHPLAGLKMFKSRFGGGEVEFIGEHDLVFHPLSYRVWQWGHKTFQLINWFRKAVVEKPIDARHTAGGRPAIKNE